MLNGFYRNSGPTDHGSMAGARAMFTALRLRLKLWCEPTQFQLTIKYRTGR